MEKLIKNKISHLQGKLDDCRIFILTCNQEIEQGTLLPNDLQQAQIDAIAEIGRNTIQEINRLNKLLNNS